MKDRELFHETFDAVPLPEGMLDAVTARAGERRRTARRGLCALAVAAALLVVLSFSAFAAWQQFRSKDDLIVQANRELDTLRRMGLFHAQFTVTEDDRVPEEPGMSAWVFSDHRLRAEDGSFTDDHLYYYDIEVDPDTGKIRTLSIGAVPQEGWEPVEVPWPEGESGSSQEPATYIYNNFDAIIDPDLTLGDYCGIWADYQGYDRWELPEGVDPETRCLDADPLRQWEGVVAIRFYRNGGEAEPVYLSYIATMSGPVIIFGSDYMKG